MGLNKPLSVEKAYLLGVGVLAVTASAPVQNYRKRWLSRTVRLYLRESRTTIGCRTRVNKDTFFCWHIHLLSSLGDPQPL